MGREFRVNTYQDNWQRNPAITTFADGSFLITWDSYFNNYDGTPPRTYVVSQRYDANGQPTDVSRIVHAIDYTSSEQPDVTVLSDGGYVVVYLYDDYDAIVSDRQTCRATVFNADGSIRVDSFRVDTVPGYDAVAPEVFATANGGFKVVFGMDNAGAYFGDIYMQQYNRNGVALGGNTLVNTNERESTQLWVQSATLNNGTTVTIWNSASTLDTPSGLGRNEIRGQITNANGTVSRADFNINTTVGAISGQEGGSYDIAPLQNGGFVVAQIAYDFELGLDTPLATYYTVFKFYNSSGNQTSGFFRVAGGNDQPDATRITQLATGEIAVIWEQPSRALGFEADIYGRIFTAGGRALTDIFAISRENGGNTDDQTDPQIAALAGGGFIVTYTSTSIDSDEDGIAARIYGRATAGNDNVAVDASGMMLGLAGNDTITGSGRSNTILGGNGNDRASGLAGADRVGGGNGRDVLVGGDGNDTLTGGQGNDTLTGNAGADRFIFANTANAANRDVITAFSGVDVLALDNAVFRALGATGNLAPSMFKMIGTGANADSNDRIIYDKRNGVVYYDTNGSGEGGRFAIVELDNRPTVTAADFLVI
jgi:Ca2+-binding RTX toxin-like protein